MYKWGLLLCGVLFAQSAHAQVSASAYPSYTNSFASAQPTFTRNIESEALAPLVITPSAPVVASSTAPAATGMVGPFTIKDVTVVLSQTAGFARDTALDQAAKQALPKVLEALPMDATEANEKAKAVGEPLRFVSSYKIVKEALIPTYSLIVDLTFNEPLLRSNFGGVKTGPLVVTSATSTVTVSASVPVMKNRYIVRVTSVDPGSQDRVYKILSNLAMTNASYRVMAGMGAEFNVETPLSEANLDAALSGTGAVVALAGEMVSTAGAAPSSVSDTGMGGR